MFVDNLGSVILTMILNFVMFVPQKLVKPIVKNKINSIANTLSLVLVIPKLAMGSFIVVEMVRMRTSVYVIIH